MSAYGIALDGFGLDPDEHLFRPLSARAGQRGEHLPAFQQEKMQAVAKYLYRSNPVASRLASLMSDFVLGEGVSLSFRNTQVEAILTEHWANPYNDWDRFGTDLYESLLVNGELLLPLFVDPASGLMTIGSVRSDNIQEVQTDPQNWRIITGVRMKRGFMDQEDFTYTVVNLRESREALRDAENPALFYKRMNPFGSRGMSLYYPIADFVDLLEQFMFSEVERWMLLKAFIWDVTVEGAADSEIAGLARKPEFATPKPGSVRLHNQNVTWKAETPRLDTYEAANGMRFLRNHIAGAVGIPEHWYAEGGDVNRATGEAMAEPARKRMSALQREWRYVLGDVLKAQLDYAILAGQLDEMVPKEGSDGEPTDELISVYDAFEINMPDLSVEDTNENATALDMTVRALALAVDEDFVSHKSAQKVVLLLAQQFGVEIDLNEEIDQIEAEKQEREDEMADAPQAQRPPVTLLNREDGQRDEEQAVGD